MRYHCACGATGLETRRPRKSTSEGVLKAGKHVIRTWSSTQTTVATSSGEAELTAMYDGATRGLEMQTMMTEMGFSPQLKMVRISKDSSVAKSFVATKMRHLEVKFLWLQEMVQMGKVRVEKVSGATNISDALTKYHGIDKQDALCRPHGILNWRYLLGTARAALAARTTGPRGGATRTPLQVELKGAPKPLAMTPMVGNGSLGQSIGYGAEEMKGPWPLTVCIAQHLKMASGTSDNQIIQSDNKFIIGQKSENSELIVIT